jgi:hypothetical protein
MTGINSISMDRADTERCVACMIEVTPSPSQEFLYVHHRKSYPLYHHPLCTLP